MIGVLRFLSVVLTGVSVAFFAGYIAFVLSLPNTPNAASADGIVVLTGGGGARISEGLSLLENSSAQRLLISGVFEATTDADLAQFGPGNLTRFDCCVDVGRNATDTVGNGLETAEWAASNNLSRIYVVTHAFHMPRALLELRRAAPDVEFMAWPVGGAFTRGPRRTTVEYIKFLVILTRDSITEAV